MEGARVALRDASEIVKRGAARERNLRLMRAEMREQTQAARADIALLLAAGEVWGARAGRKAGYRRLGWYSLLIPDWGVSGCLGPSTPRFASRNSSSAWSHERSHEPAPGLEQQAEAVDGAERAFGCLGRRLALRPIEIITMSPTVSTITTAIAGPLGSCGGSPPFPIRARDRAAFDHQQPAFARGVGVQQVLRDHGVVEVRGRDGVDVGDNIADLDLAGHRRRRPEPRHDVAALPRTGPGRSGIPTRADPSGASIVYSPATPAMGPPVVSSSTSASATGLGNMLVVGCLV